MSVLALAAALDRELGLSDLDAGARLDPAHQLADAGTRALRAIGRDTTVVLWVIARPEADLDQLSSRITALGAHVRVVSRFVHGVSAQAPSSLLR